MLLALQHFEVYVGASSSPVVVYTDHNPLVSLTQMYNHNQRLMRWALLAQGYNLEIKHKKGTDNVVADALSHGWEVKKKKEKVVILMCSMLSISDVYSVQGSKLLVCTYGRGCYVCMFCSALLCPASGGALPTWLIRHTCGTSAIRWIAIKLQGWKQTGPVGQAAR